MKRKININNHFIPCPMEEGDEIFPNGIFVFNIAMMLDAIDENLGQYPHETIVVRVIL